MDEQKKYEVIKGLSVHPVSCKERTALTLSCTVRHINCMLAAYQQSVKEYFIHGNYGYKPANTIKDDTKSLVINLYQNKYYSANFTHNTELLGKHETTSISVSKILEAEYILSPKVTRTKQKRVKKHLKNSKKAARTQKAADTIQTNLVAVEDAHSRCSRVPYLVELIQMDATPFK